MWIDDYLKYILHRELGHFTKVSDTHTLHYLGGTATIPSRVQSAKVFKDRILGGQNNLRRYTLEDYIPTLFWGILMDGWIRAPADSKELTPFVKALGLALRRGIFDESERFKLRAALNDGAIGRINEVIKIWSDLKTRKGDLSFAALWVSGDKTAVKTALGALTLPSDEWLGWGLLREPPSPDIQTLDQLRDPVRKIVSELIEDMCTYIDWTLDWPKFVQSVRAVRNGNLELDVTFGRKS